MTVPMHRVEGSNWVRGMFDSLDASAKKELCDELLKLLAREKKHAGFQ